MELALPEKLEKLKSFIMRRAQAYRATFNNPVGERVLRDIALFCRANDTPFHENERLHLVLTGRHEVWLRIASHLNLPDNALWEKYGRKDLEE